MQDQTVYTRVPNPRSQPDRSRLSGHVTPLTASITPASSVRGRQDDPLPAFRPGELPVHGGRARTTSGSSAPPLGAKGLDLQGREAI